MKGATTVTSLDIMQGSASQEGKFIFVEISIGQLQEDGPEVIPEMEVAEAETTGKADQEALSADIQDPALDQMIAAEKAATMADVVMTAVSVVETAAIVPTIAELTETTDGQDLAPLVGIAAVAPLAEPTRSQTNRTSRRTTPRPKSTTTTNPAPLSATIEIIYAKTLTNPY